jgi:photosynthetic reaction center cytochrome c subunit
MTTTLMKAGLLAGLPLLLAGCEIGPKESQQQGFRGTGMVQINNPNMAVPAAVIPDEGYRDWAPDRSPDAERAGAFYENVQVLGDLSTDEFNRLMVAITAWVSPEGSAPNGGCNYCHNPENMASDEVYTKIVSRRMIQMNRAINVNWTGHVQKTGVTCYTCHRGQPVPANYWTSDPQSMARMGILGNRHGQNNPEKPAAVVSSLPYDPFTTYLKERDQTERAIRVAGRSAYPLDGPTGATLGQTERTYGLMMHMSDSLGVNCTFCHNTNSFQNWSGSSAQRAISWNGIRMVRDSNENYIAPLASVFPANRLGPGGDAFKVNCTTCHQGQNKPLGGISMIGDFPELARIPAAAPVVAAPTTAEAPTESAATTASAASLPAG